MSKRTILPLFLFLLLSLVTSHTQAVAADCVVPDAGPWPPCATGQPISDHDYFDNLEGIIVEEIEGQGYVAVITGEYHNSCINAVSFTAQRSGNIFTIIEDPLQPPILAPCLQVITPFQKRVPLDMQRLPSGQYTVRAGSVSATFNFDQTASSECVIPESGPWPSCATGGSVPPAPTESTCVIPESGPWPPCATGGATPSPMPEDPTCVIPPSGPWPECAK